MTQEKTLGEMSHERRSDYVRIKKGIRPYGGRKLRLYRLLQRQVEVFAPPGRLDDIRTYTTNEIEEMK